MSDDTLRRGLIEAARKLQVLHAENEELRRRIASAGGDAVVQRVEKSDTPLAVAPSQPAQPRLTRSQRWMWLLHQLAPGEPTYHVFFGVRLRGRLDRDALRRAVDELVAHHDVLRMSVHGSGAEPVVIVHADARINIEERDFRAVPEVERQKAFDEAAARFSRGPLPLDLAPCGRALLATLADDEHALMFVWQHLVMDGTSCGLLVREVLARYEAIVSGRPAATPVTRWTSSDYAAWEETDLSDARLAALRDYWATRLRETVSLDLPTDRAPIAARDDRGAFLSVDLPPLIGRALKGLAVEHGCTTFATLATAVAVLLHRYSGQDDIALAVATANRRHAEARHLIGCFINTFVLRMDVADDPTASELLRRTRGGLAEAMAHQELPFDELPGLAGGRIAPPRVSLAMESIDLAAPASAGLHCEPVLASISADAPGTAKFDLSFSFAEVGGWLRGTIGYRVGLFDHETIERMAGHLTMLIEAMAERPEVQVSRLRILTAGEMTQLDAWNATVRPRDGERMLHRLVERQAARTPEAIAVRHNDTSLTYTELNARANALAAHLARHLGTHGIARGARIGVYLERSVDLIVALLAVLKTGSAYVPIDIEYPVDRVRFMLEDSGCAIALVSERSRDSLPSVAGLGIVDVRSAATSAAADAPERSSERESPNDLAYLIYTSGSTGTPKAVAIEHRSATELVAWALESYSRDDLALVLASTSICFDLSVFEIFVPLCAGGTVVVVRNALALAEGSGRDVRLLNTVPSAAAELLRLGAIPNTVRVINLAGEPLRASLVDALYAGTQVRDVYDLYGPSEDTTYSTWTRRDPGGPETIGRPVSNTRAYVLDRHDALVPVNVPGQLHLAGAGLARGYFCRDALTAGRFVPDPFGAPGDRMYRTGDLVRRRSDGRLEYLGRMDRQIKLRGYRIELGEIEAAFVSHAAVRECAVIVQSSGTSDATIVAFITVQTDPPAVAALRTHVAAMLPAYMVPQRVIVVDSLPLTRNGKLDHAALVRLVASADATESIAATSPMEAPIDAIEHTIATIWADELHRNAIGRHDHFFDLGGHSLVATRVASRLESVLGRKVPVTALFQYPVLSALADHLRGAPAPTRADVADVVAERVNRQARGIRNFQHLKRAANRLDAPLANEEQ